MEHIDHILDTWKRFVKDELLPIMALVGATVEGNYYSYNLTTDYYEPNLPKQKNIIMCANERVTKVLEVGFNGGFSAVLFLLANPKLSITCVDNGSHPYVMPCYEYIKSVFGERIHLLIGDSAVVLPDLKRGFDIIHIDGGHDVEVATKDLCNAKLLASDTAYIIMNDIDYAPLETLWSGFCAMYNLQECGYVDSGHSIKKYQRATEIAFYTCYFGPGNINGSAKHIAMQIPRLPSLIYDCCYFTNNVTIREALKNTGWICVFLDSLPIKHSDNLNAFDTKELKSCPHRFPMLDAYTYLCYCDSKYSVNENRVKEHIKMLTGTRVMILPTHPDIGPDVWSEYEQCLFQPRYSVDKDRYFNYIQTQLAAGFPSKTKIHYTTQFMIRKNNLLTRAIGEKWYEHIQMCGIECQISFFFVHQMFESYICGVNSYDGYFWT